MFIWKREFELLIPAIDNQHKRLFEIGNRIDELLVNHAEGDDNYDEIIEVIKSLEDYTIYHFKVEEDLFVKYNYTEYVKHKKEHDGFIEYLHTFDLDSIHENQGEFLNDLLGKIVNWVFNHIITTDYLYKDFLISMLK